MKVKIKDTISLRESERGVYRHPVSAPGITCLIPALQLASEL